MLIACNSERRNPEIIPASNFITAVNGKQTGLYTIKNSKGMVAQFTNYGARIVALWVPDGNGDCQDVVWGYDSIEKYLTSTDIYCGPIVGRFGNRINKGQFELDGQKHQLTINNGSNHLHGGTGGFECKVWDAEMIVHNGQEAVKMTYLSEDGEEGYPGNLTLSVIYSLTEKDGLVIDYKATTDAETIVNPTSHAYFNLNGTTDNTILSHVLQINSKYFTPTDEGLIPTGELREVEGTPLDFRVPVAIGERINADYEPLKFGLGYDHNFVLSKESKAFDEAAVIYSPESGICMSIMTDQPGLQFYSGNFMDGKDIGKRGDIHNYRTGFALEAQNFPDAPNHEHFPSSLLKPGEVYEQKTMYLFSTR